MIASKKLSYGDIKILSFNKEAGKVKVQCGEDKPVERKLKFGNSITGRDAMFQFIGTNWFLDYDFGLKFDGNGDLSAKQKAAAIDQYPFFVYGTLRSGMRNHYNFFPSSVEGINLAAKTTSGVLFHRNGLPYMFESDGESEVIGDIVHIKPEAYRQVLQRIDGLEGYFPNRRDDYNHYVRKLITCVTAEGEEVKAWAYFAGDDVVRNKQVSEIEGWSRYVRITDGNYVRWHKEYEGW